ncbi:MAG: ABC transporter permease [Micrococcales bacterium]
MSFTYSAVAIAERRIGKMGAGLFAGRPGTIAERNLRTLRSSSGIMFLAGFVEPVLILIAFGYGVGGMVGNITDASGHTYSYVAYIMPALLATSAMNGAIFDSTWNVYFKMHFAKLYNAMLATSLGTLDVAIGEIGWAMLRGGIYASSFVIVVALLGLVPSFVGAILAIIAATLVAFGFASIGMGITSYVKSFQQLDMVTFFLLPMFLFSGTLFPLTLFPEWLQWIIQALPLRQAIELVRDCMHLNLGWNLLGHFAYFAVMIIGGLFFTTRRLTALFLR